MRLIFIISALLGIFPSLVFGGTCSSSIPQGTTESCNVIVDNGVTVTFSANQTIGQYILGDYFVVLPSGSIAATISPAPVYDGDDTRNGAQVNPTTHYQPFDGRPDYYFDVSLGFSSGDTVSAGDSLVMTVSDTDSTDDEDVIGRFVDNHESYIDSASVLTVVATQPSSNSFRPAAFGTTKTVYDYDNVDLAKFANMIVTNTSVSHTADSGKSITENYADYFKRPWIQWCYYNLGRQIHPLSNMPNYYEYVNNIISEGILIANSNLTGKEDVIKGMIQVGIDASAVLNGGAGDRSINSIPVLMAAVALDESGLMSTSTKPKEIGNTYYGTGWPVTNPTALFKFKNSATHEEYNPSAWPTIFTDYGNGCKIEAYRRATHSNAWTGMALGIRVMQAETIFNHDAFLDYMDRWRSETDSIDDTNIAIIQTYCTGSDAHGLEPGGATTSSFVTALWNTYRDDLPVLAEATCSNTASMCMSESTCTTASWYWYDSECHGTAEPSTNTAPTLSSFLPSTAQSSGTTGFTISVDATDSDGVAGCKANLNSDADYADMGITLTNSSGTYSSARTGAVDGGSYYYYFRCQDDLGLENTTGTLLTVTVNTASTEVCDSSHLWLCTEEGESACTTAGFNWHNGGCYDITDSADTAGDDVLGGIGTFTTWADGLPSGFSKAQSAQLGTLSNVDGDISVAIADGEWPPTGVKVGFGEYGDGHTYRYYLNFHGDKGEIYTLAEGSVYFTTAGSYTGTITTSEDDNWVYLQSFRDGSSNISLFDDFVVYRVAPLQHGFKQVGSSF